MSLADDRSTRGHEDETSSHIESLDSASTIASRRARLQLQLQRLEEEQAILKKKAALEIEEEFTRKKYEALEASIADDAASVRSKVSKGKTQQQVHDWMTRLETVPVGETNQDAIDVREELVGAVGGVNEKSDPEKDKAKIYTPPPAAQRPANEDQSKKGDRISQTPMPEDIEDLRHLLRAI